MYERLRREAELNWAQWATALADGGQPPEPLALLEAGGLLGIDQPADALEKDARAIREVRDLGLERIDLAAQGCDADHDTCRQHQEQGEARNDEHAHHAHGAAQARHARIRLAPRR